MFSYWEKVSLLNYDYVVVGAGIVGLSTAIYLKKRESKAQILVLERGLLPDGASTKNAGFACIGSLSEIVDDLQHMSTEEVIQLVKMRLHGLRQMRTLLGDDNVGYHANGSYEILPPGLASVLDRLASVNELLSPVTETNPFTLSHKKPEDFGFHPQFGIAIVENNLEGSLHTGKMMKSLLQMAYNLGIEVKFGAEVKKIEEGSQCKVVCTAGKLEAEYHFSARKVAVCTNAFSRRFLPNADIQPGRGLVLITEPVPDLKLKGIFHYDRGYFYFREVDGRVLLGGGRNIDRNGETTTEHGINEKIQQLLLNMLYKQIIPGKKVEVAMMWSGIMAFGASKMPIISQVSEHVYAGVRMGGMGVAIGTGVGERLAEMMSKS